MSELEKIRGELEKNIGRKVSLRINRGRCRETFCEGTLKNTFSNVFTVEVEGPYDQRTYTYGDVLTNNLQYKVLN